LIIFRSIGKSSVTGGFKFREHVDGMCILFDFDFFALEGRTYAFGITWSLVFTSTNQIILPQNLKIIMTK
jgi:hypothetical protein